MFIHAFLRLSLILAVCLSNSQAVATDVTERSTRGFSFYFFFLFLFFF
jgi:hypothetical protein